MPTLPPLLENANKYTRGSVLLLAGSRRYFGAAVLATKAAERAGAGYVSLATPTSAAQAARAHLLCPVLEAQESESGGFAAASLSPIISELNHLDALCCGPGLTITNESISFVDSVLQHAEAGNIPLVLDADALGALAAKPEMLLYRQTNGVKSQHQKAAASAQNPLVLTPHTGELNRLKASLVSDDDELAKLQTQHGEVPGLALHLATSFNAIVIAKGPTSYIAQEDSLVALHEATPALAKAGTGDVLAGLVASLIAQGMVAGEAAVLAVHLHSRAGVLAEQTWGRRSVTAEDVIQALPQAIQEYE